MKLRSLDRRLVILVTIVAIAGRLALAAVHLEASHDRHGASYASRTAACAPPLRERAGSPWPPPATRGHLRTRSRRRRRAPPAAPSVRLSPVTARARLPRAEPRVARSPARSAPSALPSSMVRIALRCAPAAPALAPRVLVEALVSNTAHIPGRPAGDPQRAALLVVLAASALSALVTFRSRRRSPESGRGRRRDRARLVDGARWSGSRSARAARRGGADGESDGARAANRLDWCKRVERGSRAVRARSSICSRSRRCTCSRSRGRRRGALSGGGLARRERRELLRRRRSRRAPRGGGPRLRQPRLGVVARRSGRRARLRLARLARRRSRATSGRDARARDRSARARGEADRAGAGRAALPGRSRGVLGAGQPRGSAEQRARRRGAAARHRSALDLGARPWFGAARNRSSSVWSWPAGSRASLTVVGVDEQGLVERLGVPRRRRRRSGPDSTCTGPGRSSRCSGSGAARSAAQLGHEGEEERGPENVLWARQHAASEYTLLLGNGRDLIAIDAAVQFRIPTRSHGATTARTRSMRCARSRIAR